MRNYYVLSVPSYEGFTADIFRSTILSCCRQTIILTEEKSNSDSQQQRVKARIFRF